MASITVNKNQPYNIDVNAIANNSSDGNWKIISNQLVHDNNKESYIDLVDSTLTIGDTYRVTYTITNFTSCSFRVDLGDTLGTIRSGNGTYTEVLNLTGTKKIRFFSNGFGTISYFKLEHLVTNLVEIPVDLTDNTKIENKSFTLSYNPILEQWVSYHSYLPNNYVIHPDKLIVKANDTQLKLTDSGDYGVYFDNEIKPWIIETIFNDSPLNTKVFDNVTINLETININNAPVNKFFDQATLYNEFQCSGTFNLDTTNLTKKEKNWMIHKFSDLTTSTTGPIFSSDWDDIQTFYPIDKVVNNSKIDLLKPWYQRGRFRDKYLAVRFSDNNLDNSHFMLKFALSTYRISQR